MRSIVSPVLSEINLPVEPVAMRVCLLSSSLCSVAHSSISRFMLSWATRAMRLLAGLSMPTPYLQSSLNTPDSAPFAGRMLPGSNCADAPIRRNGQDGWLLEQLGRGFTLLSFGPAQPVSVGGICASVLEVGKDIEDRDGLLAQRYDGQPGTVYLIRPDQYVAARWRQFDPELVRAALARALKLQ